MAKADDRGSKLQHLIYQLLLKLYPSYEVVYEYVIGDLNQRIDIFIPILGLAIEVDGIQHFKFNKFFFKDEQAWYASIRLDERKNDYLAEKGVKLVRIPYNTAIASVEDLKAEIDATPYPDIEYLGLSQTNEYKEHVKNTYKQKVIKQLKSKSKEADQQAYDGFKEKRKEIYKLQKERQKAQNKKLKSGRNSIYYPSDESNSELINSD